MKSPGSVHRIGRLLASAAAFLFVGSSLTGAFPAGDGCLPDRQSSCCASKAGRCACTTLCGCHAALNRTQEPASLPVKGFEGPLPPDLSVVTAPAIATFEHLASPSTPEFLRPVPDTPPPEPARPALS